jgi:hypothetical protein
MEREVARKHREITEQVIKRKTNKCGTKLEQGNNRENDVGEMKGRKIHKRGKEKNGKKKVGGVVGVETQTFHFTQSLQSKQ